MRILQYQLQSDCSTKVDSPVLAKAIVYAYCTKKKIVCVQMCATVKHNCATVKHNRATKIILRGNRVYISDMYSLESCLSAKTSYTSFRFLVCLGELLGQSVDSQ